MFYAELCARNSAVPVSNDLAVKWHGQMSGVLHATICAEVRIIGVNGMNVRFCNDKSSEF